MKPLRQDVRDAAFSVREISDRAAAMDDVIRFDIGQPDFDTPETVKQAVQEHITTDHITYTSLWGIPRLRELIAAQAGPDRSPEQVLVTTGGIGGLYCILNAALSPGDTVLANDPAWAPYTMIAASTPGTIRQVPYFRDGAVDEDRVRDAIEDDTKAMIINTPENPTGRVYTEQAVRTLGGIAAEHDLFIIADEVYDRLVYTGEHVSPAALFPDRTFVVNSVSKNFAMTGWRLGWVTAPDTDVVYELGKVNRATTACPNYLGQHAAVTALEQEQDYVEQMRQAFKARRDLVMARVNELGWDCVTPGGAIYVFPEVGQDARSFAVELLKQERVSVVPGAAFGSGSGTNIRLCFGSVDTDGVTEGFDRIQTFLS